jgi:primosomal protein N'
VLLVAAKYGALAPVATRVTSCTHCGGPFEVVDGARRVVCEHCGRLADVIA